VIKSRRMRWTEHLLRFGGEEKCVQGFGEETWRERDNVEDVGVDGRVII
jgi:hypothetical protein